MQGRSSAWSLGGSHLRAALVPEEGRSFHRGAGAARHLPAGGMKRPGHGSTHGHLKAALGSRLAHLGLCYIGVSAPLSWDTSGASPTCPELTCGEGNADSGGGRAMTAAGFPSFELVV